MKNFKSAQAAVSILTVATVIGLCVAPAQAAPITISVSGVFDTVPTLPGGNGASSLLGTAYSASYTVSTNGADATATERGLSSSVDSNGTTIDAHGWKFVSPTAYGPGNNTLTTKLGSYSNGEVATIYVGNNFYYDGVQGMLNMLIGAYLGVNMVQPAGTGLSAGTYDVIGFIGDLHNWPSCSGGSVIFEEGCHSFYQGPNVSTTFVLIGTSDMLQDSDTYPLGGHMDLSQVRYGMFFAEARDYGALTGLAIQDPPLTLVNGVLVGPGMSAAVTVPEPGTFALLSMGLGLMGLVARRRQRNHSARPAALDCAAY